MDRRLAAILVADVAGYTRLVEQDTESTVAAWRLARIEVIDPSVTARAGRLVKLTGDGFLAEFGSVEDAVRCAVTMQAELKERPLDFRMGIHLGDIVDDGDDIHGEGVNIAARIEALAQPNGICISADVHNQVRNRLRHHYEDLGEVEVKHVSAPIRVYRIVGPGATTAPLVSEALTRPAKPSIVVLPFDNMSVDPDQEYFADGLTEDIITDLSRFQALFVIARNTAFTYKGEKVRVTEIADDLGVQFVLEGSVRRSNDRVRVTAQLIDGDNGRHVWAERYDGKLEDVFDLQEEVTRQVVASVAPQIDMAELDHAGSGKPRFDEAHDLGWRSYAMAIQGLGNANPPRVDEAIELARRALSLNQRCAVAYQALVFAYTMQNLYSWGADPVGAAGRALDAANAAMSVFPRTEVAYRLLGAARLRNRQFEQAVHDLRLARELNPNNAYTLILLAFGEATMGDLASAKEHAALAIRLSPKDRATPIAHLSLAMVAFVERDHAALIEWANKAIQGDPVAPIRRALLIAHAADVGDRALLHMHLDDLSRFAPEFIPSLFRGEIQVFNKREHMDMLLESLRKAGLPDG